jgi:carbonic anhydrase
LEKLLQGIFEFQQDEFEKHRELFRDLGNKQEPHTLFVGCSDSRIVPNMITKTAPGELFTIRNIANIVPPYRKTEEYVATTAAIEYAVSILNVEAIVVCGHSNCGGCNALFYDDAEMKKIPHVKKWLELASDIKEKVEKVVPKGDLQAREWMAEQLNVVLQLEHLLTYPGVEEKIEAGTLSIMGWHYIIETGEIYNYNFDKRKFELLRVND